MSTTQRKALKKSFRTNVKLRRVQLKRLTGIASRFHVKGNRYYRKAVSSIKKEIRFYNRLGLNVR